MIIDRLEKAPLYLRLHGRLAAVFEYLRKAGGERIEPGTYEIEGRKVYVMAQHYDTRPREKGRWEAHRKYMDVQFVHQGTELFGYAHLGEMKEIQYDEVKDFLSLEGEGRGDFFRLSPGTFVILFPQDAHMPGIAVSAPQPVKKLVVKVAIDD